MRVEFVYKFYILYYIYSIYTTTYTTQRRRRQAQIERHAAAAARFTHIPARQQLARVRKINTQTHTKAAAAAPPPLRNPCGTTEQPSAPQNWRLWCGGGGGGALLRCCFVGAALNFGFNIPVNIVVDTSYMIVECVWLVSTPLSVCRMSSGLWTYTFLSVSIYKYTHIIIIIRLAITREIVFCVRV